MKNFFLKIFEFFSKQTTPTILNNKNRKKSIDLIGENSSLSPEEQHRNLELIIDELRLKETDIAKEVNQMKTQNARDIKTARLNYLTERKNLLTEYSRSKKELDEKYLSSDLTETHLTHFEKKALLNQNKAQAKKLKRQLSSQMQQTEKKLRKLVQENKNISKRKLRSQIKVITTDFDNYRAQKLVQAASFKAIKPLSLTRTRLRQSVQSSIRWANVRRWSLIFLGTLLMVICFDYFVQHGKFYTGGVTGIMQAIVYNAFPSGSSQKTYYFVLYAAVNVPLVIFGFFKVGKLFTLKSVTVLVMMNVFNLLIVNVPTLKNLTFWPKLSDPNNVSGQFIFGAVAALIWGSGLGLVYFSGGSTAGTDFLAAYYSLKKQKNIGNVTRIFNFCSILLSELISYAFKANQIGFWTFFFHQYALIISIVFVFITSLLVNLIYPQFKLVNVMIVTSIPTRLTDFLYKHDYKYGGSSWRVKSIRQGKEKVVIMTCLPLLSLRQMRNSVALIDPHAFVIVTNKISVLGKFNFSKLN